MSKRAVITGILLFLPFLYFAFSFPEPSLSKDAGDFHSYAVNLLVGNGYSIDGLTFSNFREPGYPVLLALVYTLFGVGNTTALAFVQALLLGATAVLVFRLFEETEDWSGILAGVVVALLPLYATYIPRVAPELLYTFLIVACVFFSLQAFRRPQSYLFYIVFGVVCACATLVRSQALFLPLVLLGVFFFFNRQRVSTEWRRIVSGFLVYGALIMLWMTVAFFGTGNFALTEGRPELSLHLRASRAEHSFSDNTQYAIDWFKRSLTGGTETPLLTSMDYRSLTIEFVAQTATPEAREALKEQNIAILLDRPLHYLYGTGIEALKLSYIEHDYTGFLPRSVRALTYVTLYLLAVIGFVSVIRYRTDRVSQVGVVALLFILYNYAIVIPFDALPRYNTPFLALFAVLGVTGLTLMMRGAFRLQRERVP